MSAWGNVSEAPGYVVGKRQLCRTLLQCFFFFSSSNLTSPVARHVYISSLILRLNHPSPPARMQHGCTRHNDLFAQGPHIDTYCCRAQLSLKSPPATVFPLSVPRLRFDTEATTHQLCRTSKTPHTLNITNSGGVYCRALAHEQRNALTGGWQTGCERLNITGKRGTWLEYLCKFSKFTFFLSQWPPLHLP